MTQGKVEVRFTGTTEAAGVIGVHPKTLAHWCASKKIPRSVGFKVGKQWRFDMERLLEHFQKKRKGERNGAGM